MPAIAFLKDQDAVTSSSTTSTRKSHQSQDCDSSARPRTTSIRSHEPTITRSFDRESSATPGDRAQEQVIELAGAKHSTSRPARIPHLRGQRDRRRVDITERKRAEQALRELTEAIARRQRSRENEAVQIALDQVCAHTALAGRGTPTCSTAEGDLHQMPGISMTIRLETFRSVTDGTRFASGVGYAGAGAGHLPTKHGSSTSPRIRTFHRAHLATESIRPGRRCLSGPGRGEGRRLLGFSDRGCRSLRPLDGVLDADRSPARQGYRTAARHKRGPASRCRPTCRRCRSRIWTVVSGSSTAGRAEFVWRKERRRSRKNASRCIAEK